MMKAMNTWVAGAAFLLVLPVTSSATVMQQGSSDQGNGLISLFECGQPTVCSVSKSFTQIGDMIFSFSNDTNEIVSVVETITNNTGIPWTDFHWTLSEENGNVIFQDVINFGPFTTLDISPDGKSANLAGGTLANGGSFNPGVLLNVQDVGGGLFQLSQVPTVTVPEPASVLLMGLGLAGLGIATRRRRARA